jgi:CRP-like cAMP-binding protein
MLGEFALISSAPSALTVMTREPCKLLSLPRSKFRKLHAAMPDLRERVRDLHKLRRNLMTATLSANSIVTTASMRADDEDDEYSAEEWVAATCIQRFARGKSARQYCRDMQSSREHESTSRRESFTPLSFGLRAAGAEPRRPWKSTPGSPSVTPSRHASCGTPSAASRAGASRHPSTPSCRDAR